MAKRVTDPDQDSDGPGGSNVPDDIIELHTRLIMTAQAKKATADAELQNVYKAAKSAGINLGPIKRAIKAKKGDPAMADIDLRDEIRYREILAVPVGWARDGQGRFLFGDVDLSEEAEQKRDDFDDFEDGKSAGLDGHSMTTNPHQEGDERYKTWRSGWEAGQTELLTKGQKKQAAKKPRGKGASVPPVH